MTNVIDLTNLTATQGFIIQGDAAGDWAGFSVSSAGDINGDGFDDMIVGASGGGNGGDRAGEAYVVFGKATGLANIDLTTLTATQGFIIQGDAAVDYAGVSVSSAGDVNGDGFDDIIVGAPGGGNGGINAGEAYVIFGKATGLANIDLTNLTATQGFIIQGDAAVDRAGLSVSSAGDVNGDGFDDVIIGANGGDNGGTDAGEAYVIFGRALNFAPDIADDLSPSSLTENVLPVDTNVGTFTVTDPEGDAFTVAASDPRFEVRATSTVGTFALVALAGSNIDFEQQANIPVVVVATDTSSGFSGKRTFTISVTDVAQEIVDASSSTENLTLIALGPEDMSLTGGSGNDRLTTGSGNDTMAGNGGDDVLNGGLGTDTADYSAATSGTTVVLGNRNIPTVSSGSDFLISIENLTGSAFNDRLVGDVNGNVIRGGAGGDSLDGGDGADFLFGEAGDDGFRASGGPDAFDGGTGVDFVNYYYQAQGVSAFLDGSGTNARAALGDTFTAIENLIGSAIGNDLLYGDAGANRLTGLGGDDTLRGRGGGDLINGGAGDDTLIGDQGADVYVTGSGLDTIVFNRAPLAAERDRITDFVSGSDTLRIVAAVFGGGLVAGGLVQLVANSNPGAANGNATFLYDTDNGVLKFDADGNGAGAAETFVWLQFAPTLAVSDFDLI